MIVKYFAYYRKYAGRKEETLSLGPVTAIELLRELISLHGSALRKELLTADGDEIHPDVIFLVNGRNIDFLKGKDSVLEGDAVISLFPRIAGG
jgi:molybdopterin synthase sulfur carrier subunit